MYITSTCDAGGITNTSIVIAVGLGIVKRMDPSVMVAGGHVVLQKSWAKYLLEKMKFVKCKATTKKPKFTEGNFEEIFDKYQVVVTMEDVPKDMVVSWDQTVIKCIPLSNWTMAQRLQER